MKKNIILFLIFALTQPLLAQTAIEASEVQQSVEAQNKGKKNKSKYKRIWMDFQVAQHFGLSGWSKDTYVNDGLPANMITDIRAVGNLLFFENMGMSLDLGLGIMPAPKMKSLDLEKIPMPYNNTKYYIRNMWYQDGNEGISTHFKMTLNLFGKIPISEKLDFMPHFGAGFITMGRREYGLLLKEDGSNMQYYTNYVWNCKYEGQYSPESVLGYLNARLNLKYKLKKSSLLFGLEYSWFLNTLNFYGKYTNTFNANVERSFFVKGNKMNMVGVSVGISL